MSFSPPTLVSCRRAAKSQLASDHSQPATADENKLTLRNSAEPNGSCASPLLLSYSRISRSLVMVAGLSASAMKNVALGLPPSESTTNICSASFSFFFSPISTIISPPRLVGPVSLSHSRQRAKSRIAWQLHRLYIDRGVIIVLLGSVAVQLFDWPLALQLGNGVCAWVKLGSVAMASARVRVTMCLCKNVLAPIVHYAHGRQNCTNGRCGANDNAGYFPRWHVARCLVLRFGRRRRCRGALSLPRRSRRCRFRRACRDRSRRRRVGKLAVYISTAPPSLECGSRERNVIVQRRGVSLVGHLVVALVATCTHTTKLAGTPMFAISFRRRGKHVLLTLAHTARRFRPC